MSGSPTCPFCSSQLQPKTRKWGWGCWSWVECASCRFRGPHRFCGTTQLDAERSAWAAWEDERSRLDERMTAQVEQRDKIIKLLGLAAGDLDIGQVHEARSCVAQALKLIQDRR